MPGSPGSGYHGLDAQFPTPTPSIADAWGDHKGRVRALAGNMLHWIGEKHLGYGGHSAEKRGHVDVRHLRHKVRYGILQGDASLIRVGPRSFSELVSCKAGDRERAPVADRQVAQSFTEGYTRYCRAMFGGVDLYGAFPVK